MTKYKQINNKEEENEGTEQKEIKLPLRIIKQRTGNVLVIGIQIPSP